MLQYGLLAGGLADGSVCIWNPTRIIGQPSGTDPRTQLLCRLQKHQGAVRGLEFNPFSPNLLGSGAADGDLCIWDVANPSQPSLYPAMKNNTSSSAVSGASLEITDLAWNRKVQHILATGTASSAVVVWDLKKQRPVISFKDPSRRGRCSAVEWNPDIATQLAVASDDDMSPSLQLWDLRNSVSPLLEMHGHSKGVLALSWCPQDGGFLLSSGKDNRVIVWDVSTGMPRQELPPGQNWKFDVQWAPGKEAGLFAGSTFEGKITIDTLAACQPATLVDAQGYAVPAGMGRAPGWLKRSACATLGFGGKMAKISNSKRQLPTGEVIDTATIEVKQVTIKSNTPDISEEFEQVIKSADSNALRALCDTRAAAAKDAEDAETWTFLKAHFEEDGKRYLLAKLGFEDALPTADEQGCDNEDATGAATAAAEVSALTLSDAYGHPHAVAAAAAAILAGGDNPEDDSAVFPQSPGDGGASFFDSLNTPQFSLSPSKEGARSPSGTQQNGAAPDSKAVSQSQRRPIVDGPPGEAERDVLAAVLVGDFAGAAAACAKAGRHADALIVASIIGGSAWENARLEYMHANPRPFMRIVHAVLDGDWKSFVDSRPVQAWRETLAALLTSAPYDRFDRLVARLASALAKAGAVHPATLCHVCSGNVEAAVSLWTKRLDANAPPALRESIMEKAVVLGMGAQHGKSSPDGAPPSTALGDLLARTAEELASAGRLSAAYGVLNLIPEGSSDKVSELKDRLLKSGAVDTNSAASAAASATNSTMDAYMSGAQQQEPSYREHTGYGGGGAYASSAYMQPQPPAVQQYNQYQVQQQTPAVQQQPAVFQPSVFAPGPPLAGPLPPTSLPPPPTTAIAALSSVPSTGSTTVASPRPSPPTVYQPSASAGTAGSMGGYQQHSAHLSAPPLPSPRSSASAQSHAAAPPPPTVFQPAAAPPVQQAPPPVPSPVAPTPSPIALPPPAVYQHNAVAPAPPAPPPHYGAPPMANSSSSSLPPVQPMPMQPHQLSVVPPSPQQPVMPMQPQQHVQHPPPPPPPQGPPAGVSIATADTANVPPELKSVVTSLKNLYQAAESLAGGNPAKRRELDDATRKLGGLLWRLNCGEVSQSVASKLQQLCVALDAGDYASAGHMQVMMTTSDWDECSAWLTALKRLIKIRQMGG